MQDTFHVIYQISLKSSIRGFTKFYLVKSANSNHLFCRMSKV